MKAEGKIVVVTGGASGIGKAMARRFAAEGAAHVIVADLGMEAAGIVADEFGGTPMTCDVGKAEEVETLVREVEGRHGRIDLFCSNAGIATIDVDEGNVAANPDSDWQRSWQVNVMAHVYAARYALPGMIDRGGGYFLNTVSAAGLLSQIGSAIYSTTKHAAVGFAESLAITHRSDNIGVSILCPQAVDTPLLGDAAGSQNVDGILSPETVAGCVVDGLDRESFLILPHDQVTTYMQRKTGDYDRWIKGMVRLRDSVATGERGGR